MSSKISIILTDENSESNRLFISLLKEYQSLIHSCIGPINGCLKLLSKSNDYNDLVATSSSKNLFAILYNLKDEDNQKEKWQFDLIKSIVTNCHFDHYYDSGLFLCHLINEFLILDNSYQFNKNFVDLSLKNLNDHLNKQNQITVKLDLNNIQFLKKLIKTSLNSKSLINQIEPDENEHFVNLCLKAFINSFQDDSSKQFSDIIYLFNDNNSYDFKDSQLISGVLLQTDSSQLYSQLKLSLAKSGEQFRCVLFDSSFSGDFEHLNKQEFQIEINSNEMQTNRTVFLMLNKFINLVDYLIDKFKINVFLCQKVIHPSLKSHLSKRNVIFIDRLSLMLTKPLSDLTGCKVVNCSWNLEQFDQSIFGQLTSISLKQILNKNYIHFDNQNNLKSPVQSLIVCVHNEHMTAEIQHLLKVTQTVFQKTITTGHAVCGGACFYTYSMCLNWKYLVDNQNLFNIKHKSNLINLLRVTKLVFYSFAKNLLDKDEDYKLDLNSGHLFKSSANCSCGLFVNRLNGNFIDLNEEINYMTINFKDILSIKLTNESNVELLDSVDSKINVFKLAREILTSILQIGVFIHN